ISFIPLGEEKEMASKSILNKTTTGKKYAHLLEKFDKYPVFIDSIGKVLSMPPIINSEETGKVSEKTSEIFIECSGSEKFALNKILNILAITFDELGGKVYSMELDYGNEKLITPNFNSERIKISLQNINSLLGVKLKEGDIEKLLRKMGLEYSGGFVKAPPHRLDLMTESDIIEEVAIAFGYENFIPKVDNFNGFGEENPKERLKEQIRQLLIGLGMLEILSYHMVKKEEAEKIKSKLLEIETTKSEYKFLRNSLLIPSLRTFSENKDRDYPQKIFEIGTVFSEDKKMESRVKEQENLIICSSPANFTELKQILDYLLSVYQKPCEIKESHVEGLIDGRAGKLFSDGKEIGYIGEVHPETLKEFGIKMPVSVIEIFLDDFFKM
ncbi:MAG: phenylalanine--tRNA ligase subunit beta, partial [Nanoarchaeota archaeon]